MIEDLYTKVMDKIIDFLRIKEEDTKIIDLKRYKKCKEKTRN